jgi:hypothetical protein
MAKSINPSLDSDDFEEVQRVKEDLDLTWEEFVIRAAEVLDS